MDWKTKLLPYKQATDELKAKFENISAQFELHNSFSPISSVETRVKTVPGILSKAQRKGISLDEIEEHIEDIAGIRIICRFVDDIRTVVEHIRRRADMQITQDRDYVNNMKPSGYRSHHLIISYPVIGMDGRQKSIFCEIQVRTKAMDFWAALEHNLRYKYRRSIPEDINRRLILSADAAFVLDTEMNKIREQILAAEISNRSSEEIIFETTNIIEELYEIADKFEVETLYEQFVNAIRSKSMDELVRIYDLAQKMADDCRAYAAFDNLK